MTKIKSFREMARRRSTRIRRGHPSVERLVGEAVYSLNRFTQSQQRLIEQNVAASLRQLRLDLSELPRPQLGSRVLSDSSTKGYLGNIRMLEYFLALIGDWSSILILRENAPEFAPAVRDTSLAMFISWKTATAGDIMKDSHGIIIKDAFGRQLKADGCWNSPACHVPFSAAISALHAARGFSKDMPYADVCNSCLQEYRRTRDHGRGCFHHGSQPRLWRKGNPRFSEVYKNRIRLLKVVELRGYQSNGNSPLTPRELLQIRSDLLSQNCISAYKLWTMILLSVKQFRRGDEVVSLQEDLHFLPELTVMRDDRVVSISLLVDGKRDVTPAILAVHVDDAIPELCLLRMLFAWIWISEYREGPIFPKDLSSTVLVPMTKKDFLEAYKKVCQRITGRGGPWGTHTGKKTGWLLGAWGNASDVSLAMDSRHAGLEQAQRYKQDAMGLMDIAKAAGYALIELLYEINIQT